MTVTVPQIKTDIAALPAELQKEVKDHLGWAHQHPYLSMLIALLVGVVLGVVGF